MVRGRELRSLPLQIDVIIHLPLACIPSAVYLVNQALSIPASPYQPTSVSSYYTRGGGDDLVLTMPGCMCPKVKDIGPFSASRE